MNSAGRSKGNPLGVGASIAIAVVILGGLTIAVKAGYDATPTTDVVGCYVNSVERTSSGRRTGPELLVTTTCGQYRASLDKEQLIVDGGWYDFTVRAFPPWSAPLIEAFDRTDEGYLIEDAP